jgi:SAM-dependent methyltransferase
MNCPICAHTLAWSIPFVRDAEVDRLRHQFGDQAEYAWLLCRRCGNAYPSHQPGLRVLERIWRSNRDTSSDRAASEAAWRYRRKIAQRGAARSFRLFAGLASAQPGRFLDVACGLGYTVQTFGSHGWQAEGLDADPATSPFHRELGIKASIGAIEAVRFKQSFDIIHIAHAIYFVTEPMKFLRDVREHLNSGGVLCIVLADFFSVIDPVLPAYSHSFFPTASSMCYALALAGFETLFARHESGSIFIAARPAAGPLDLPAVFPRLTYWKFLTKRWRFAAFGKPYLAFRKLLKSLLRP